MATKGYYQINDGVLPMLDLGSAPQISLTLDRKEVELRIGARVIIWDRQTGEVLETCTDTPLTSELMRKAVIQGERNTK
jgi:hypothetical protein